jgi:hypothetical protein
MQEMEQRLLERKNRYTSFQNLGDEDYPGFFSIREFILMVDGCLDKSFFVRDRDSKLIKCQGAKIQTDKTKAYKIRQGDQ